MLNTEDTIYLGGLRTLLWELSLDELRHFVRRPPSPIGHKTLGNKSRLQEFLFSKAMSPLWRPYLERETHWYFSSILVQYNGDLAARVEAAVADEVPIYQLYWVLLKTDGPDAEEVAMRLLENHGTSIEELVTDTRAKIADFYQHITDKLDSKKSPSKKEKQLQQQLDLLDRELDVIKRERDSLKVEAEELKTALNAVVTSAAEDAKIWSDLLAKASGKPNSHEPLPILDGMRVLVIGDPSRAFGYLEILKDEFGAKDPEFRNGVECRHHDYAGFDLIAFVTAYAKHKTEEQMEAAVPAGVSVVYIPIAGLASFRRCIEEWHQKQFAVI